MDATEVNARWQAEMAEFFVDLGDATTRQGLPAARGDLPPRGPARRARPQRPTRSDLTMTDLPRHRRPARRRSRSRCPRGPTATPAPGSRCSARPARPRTVEEKIADAADGAPVHRAGARRSRCTSRGTRSTTTPSSRAYAEDLGRRGSARSTRNTFQDDDYKLGSLTHADPAVRQQGDRPQPRVHRHHGRRPARAT